MKTSDAYALFQAIQRLQNDMSPRPVKFGYALAVNLKRLQEIAEAFEAARTKLIKETAELDEQGEPVVADNMYKLRDTARFNADIATLQNSEIEVALMKVNIDDMPSEMEPVLVALFMPMINEPA